MPAEARALVLVLNCHRATRSTSSVVVQELLSRPQAVMQPTVATAAMALGQKVVVVVGPGQVRVAKVAMAAAVPVQASAHAAALVVPAVLAAPAIIMMTVKRMMRLEEPMVLTVLVAEALVPWALCM